jgi:RNA recognition motif-containing protein
MHRSKPQKAIPFEDTNGLAVTIPDDESDEAEEVEALVNEPTDDEMRAHYQSMQLRKLFIGNLPYKANTENMKAYFAKYGEIVDCNVPFDARTKLSKGFGFIVFQQPETLDMIMKEKIHRMEGRLMELKRAIRREEASNPAANAATKKLFLSPLSGKIGLSDLEEYFGKHGEVVNVNYQEGNDYAFVTFTDNDPVDKLVNMKQHRVLAGCPLVTAKKGLTKSQMAEAHAKYNEKKKNRFEREEREKTDYDMVKKGFMKVEDTKAPHRVYPKEFGNSGHQVPGEENLFGYGNSSSLPVHYTPGVKSGFKKIKGDRYYTKEEREKYKAEQQLKLMKRKDDFERKDDFGGRNVSDTTKRARMENRSRSRSRSRSRGRSRTRSRSPKRGEKIDYGYDKRDYGRPQENRGYEPRDSYATRDQEHRGYEMSYEKRAPREFPRETEPRDSRAPVAYRDPRDDPYYLAYIQQMAQQQAFYYDQRAHDPRVQDPRVHDPRAAPAHDARAESLRAPDPRYLDPRYPDTRSSEPRPDTRYVKHEAEELPLSPHSKHKALFEKLR